MAAIGGEFGNPDVMEVLLEEKIKELNIEIKKAEHKPTCVNEARRPLVDISWRGRRVEIGRFKII